MTKLTSRTINEPEQVLDAIRRVNSDGYALSDEELELGMRAIAVPVRNRQGSIEAALSVSVSSARVSVNELIGRFLTVLIRVAERIERAL
jgi:IclR family pca regulon transcriptional regulator